MRRVVLLVLLFCSVFNSACTTLQRTEATPQEVQRLILNEDLLKPGDRVKIVTADQSIYEFRIEQVDLEQELIIGADKQVRVEDIVALETRQVSVGKTALLAGGVAYSVWILLLIAIAPALILAGG